eukprot:CAMPEP_0116917638 /NCGR_PEP_ID=MMETSP0467-20121206/19278_1 /TAXON_ID=283647 /ORGANISM="Mesodinium pulex, Strain SPMC105" /LENGTH=39 /DNA_ID= /DNA_START= /DNA_END= /DNA_ORIENTATION=
MIAYGKHPRMCKDYDDCKKFGKPFAEKEIKEKMEFITNL